MNLKLDMILVLIVKILSQSIWNFCMKKGGTLDLMLSIDHPNVKSNHLKTFNKNKNSFPVKKFKEQFKSNFIVGLYDI